MGQTLDPVHQAYLLCRRQSWLRWHSRPCDRRSSRCHNLYRIRLIWELTRHRTLRPQQEKVNRDDQNSVLIRCGPEAQMPEWDRVRSSTPLQLARLDWAGRRFPAQVNSLIHCRVQSSLNPSKARSRRVAAHQRQPSLSLFRHLQRHLAARPSLTQRHRRRRKRNQHLAARARQHLLRTNQRSRAAAQVTAMTQHQSQT